MTYDFRAARLVRQARRDLAKSYMRTGTDEQFNAAVDVLGEYEPVCRHATTIVTVAGAVMCVTCGNSLEVSNG